MHVRDIVKALRKLAPEELAESWDHVGLQVGDPRWPVRRVLLCIDLTEAVMREAVRTNASMIVSYHPPIFDPLTGLTTRETKQRIVLEAAQRKIAIYSPHTALDAAAGGINEWLCKPLGEADIRPIKLTPGPNPRGGGGGEPRYKLIFFTPAADAPRIRAALSSAGAGVIGDYTECSFNIPGHGTFRGGKESNPTVGRRGTLETVDELRVEMVFPSDHLAEVVSALRKSHPYEEPAFDIHKLVAPPPVKGQGEVGQGRLAILKKPFTLSEAVKRYKKHLRVRLLEVGTPDRARPIKRVAVCAGAGGPILEEVRDADLYLTGEMRHHKALAAVGSGIAVIIAGHTQTERPYLSVYRRRLTVALAGKVPVDMSKADVAPTAFV